ncbi:hypothetical protein ACERII_18935 [Evansella sp. AB-rgal1]|uniref:hypothetical protein n=1 Tax=Evansella sp. AB-rgal1 TaxID=3242696 RepID=UPI00359DD3D1
MKQNLLVLLLPFSVMLGLFLFGYYTINQSHSVLNEELDSHTLLEIDTELDSMNNLIATVKWQWEDFPTDGIVGEDILEFILLNESMEPIEIFSNEGVLTLYQSSDVVYETGEAYKTNEGIAFNFPNTIKDNVMLGPKGEAFIILENISERAVFIEVKYYHTWEEFSKYSPGNSIVDSLKEQGLDNYFWILERSIRLP